MIKTRFSLLLVCWLFCNLQKSAAQLLKKIGVSEINNMSITQPVTNVPVGNCPALILTFTPQSAGYGDTVTLQLLIPCTVTSVYFGNEPALSFSVNMFTGVVKAVVGKGNSGQITIYNGYNIDAKAGFKYLPSPNAVVPFSLCTSTSAAVINSVITGSSFQWEVSLDDATFNLVNNDANHDGANTPDLKLINISSSWTGRKYRCVSNNTTSNIYKILFANWRMPNSSRVWEDPVNWSCGVLPDSNTDVLISSNVTLTSNVTVHSIKIIPGANLIITTGYTLTILK